MNESVLTLKERFQPSRFFRGEKPVNIPLTLNHRRIFILPSQRGLGFVLLIVLLLLLAFVYNNNLAYLLAFLLASIFFVTILHTFKALSGLVVAHGNSRPAFTGEAAGFDIHISNPTRQARFNLQLHLQSAHTICLAADEKKTVTLYAQTHKRGLLPCNTITVSCAYPLGFFRAWSPLRFDTQALVYPKPVNIERPFPESEGIQGEQGQGKKGGDDFFGIKPYQSGDPIRQIHWKSFAKGQGMFSKQYGGTAQSDLWLDYESTPGHNLEERLSQLCRWIIDAEKAGLHYGLILPGNKIAIDFGNKHFAKCLEALALF